MTLVTHITALNGAKFVADLKGSEHARFLVGRQMAKHALQMAGESSAKSPVASGRMKGPLSAPKELSPDGLEWAIGTNARSAPSKSYPQGYLYPIRQEFVETFAHPKGGEWGFLRKPLWAHKEKIASDCMAAWRKAMGEINKGLFPRAPGGVGGGADD